MLQMRFEGGEQLAKVLNDLPDKVNRKVLQAALVESAEPMRQSMAALAPRAPGAPDIADNMVIRPVQRFVDPDGDQVRIDDRAAAVAVGPSRPFFYGEFLEFGTVKMSPRPFMRPAYDGQVRRAFAQLSSAIWRALTKAGAGRSASPGGTGTV